MANSSPMKILSILQILLVCLSITTATVIVGTAGNIYRTYLSQHASNPWWLPLWGAHFNTLSLKTSIGTGTGVLFLNFVFLVLAMVAKVPFPLMRRTKLTIEDQVPSSAEAFSVCRDWRVHLLDPLGCVKHRTHESS
jgi:hypothetical protein